MGQKSSKGDTKAPAAPAATASSEAWLQGKGLEEIPGDLAFETLELLYVNDNNLADADKCRLMVKLEELNVSNNPKLGSVEFLPQLSCLTQLFLNELPLLTTLPEKMGDLKRLKVFQANSTGLESLPASLGECSELKQVSLTDNAALTSLENVSQWSKVEKLFLHRCALESLPDLTSMVALQKLYMNGNRNLKHLPPLPTSVDELYFAECAISELSADLLKLSDLKFLMGAQNSALKHLPEGLVSLPRLEIVHFAECALEEVGGEFGPKVAFIHLNSNNLSELPFENLKQLKLRKFEVENNPVIESHQEQVKDIVETLIVNKL